MHAKALLRCTFRQYLLSVIVLLVSFSRLHADVSFYAFVQEEHKWKPDLEGWEGTARLIAAAIKPERASVVVNQGPDVLFQMLTKPKESPGEYRILYLATHMSSEGRLSFSNQGETSPDEIIGKAQQSGSIVTPDLVIVDCCYAATFENQRAWMAQITSPHVFVCGRGEMAWQIEVNARQPLYVKKYYPEVHSLANRLMGDKWNGKLSYFGFQIACALAADEKSEMSSNPGDYLRRVVDSPLIDERIKRTSRVSELHWFENR